VIKRKSRSGLLGRLFCWTVRSSLTNFVNSLLDGSCQHPQVTDPVKLVLLVQVAPLFGEVIGFAVQYVDQGAKFYFGAIGVNGI
jgi:hypothetical protein